MGWALGVGFLIWVVLDRLGVLCLPGLHKWRKHGPTHHLAMNLKTKKLEGWSRMWWVCHRCGARRHAERIDTPTDREG